MPLHRILLIVLLVQATVALGLLGYLAAGDKALVVEIAARERLPSPETSGLQAGHLADHLVIPVAGVRAAELNDSYGAPRSGGRSHQGIDIHAPEGTPVLAAAAGVIVGRDSSALGGLSLYQRDLDQRTIYFYGHLQRYRAGMKDGDLVRAGDVVAYVGQTGNAGTPHLHFSAYTVTDPNRWRRGSHVRPCDLLPCGVPAEDTGS